MVKTPNVFLEGARSVHNPPQLMLCAALGTASLGKSCKMLPRSNERARKCNLYVWRNRIYLVQECQDCSGPRTGGLL